jgi:hypothetical protein
VTHGGAAVVPTALSVVARVLGALPRNSVLWSYTIRGLDGSPYLTRMLGPRVLGSRPLAHRIWRPDADRELHNHPWREARFVVVSGGYVEERRLASGRRATRRLTVGDVNVLDADDFHRITRVLPDTWTLGLVGDRCQDWGFWVDGEGFVAHEAYFARQHYDAPESLGL